VNTGCEVDMEYLLLCDGLSSSILPPESKSEQQARFRVRVSPTYAAGLRTF
jgi:hypothetical protein